jgi:hypothetical protein
MKTTQTSKVPFKPNLSDVTMKKLEALPLEKRRKVIAVAEKMLARKKSMQAQA